MREMIYSGKACASAERLAVAMGAAATVIRGRRMRLLRCLLLKWLGVFYLAWQRFAFARGEGG